MIHLSCPCGQTSGLFEDGAGCPVRCSACGHTLAELPSGSPHARRTSPALRPGSRYVLAGGVLLALIVGDVAFFGFLVPAARERSSRDESARNLKQIALALHAHNAAVGSLPEQAVCDSSGRPLLSWRVALLPYLKQGDLHAQFKLDEPWNSRHNSKLLDRMPKVYSTPGATGGPGLTHYQIIHGPNTLWAGAAPPRIPASFPFGTASTILVAESREPVPWTRPADIVYRPGRAPALGAGGRARTCGLVVLGDASVRELAPDIHPREVRNLIDPNEGPYWGVDW